MFIGMKMAQFENGFKPVAVNFQIFKLSNFQIIVWKKSTGKVLVN